MQFLTKFVNWNVERGQQGKLFLSSGLSEELNAFFSNENELGLILKKKNFPKFLDFYFTYSLFVKLSIDFVD